MQNLQFLESNKYLIRYYYIYKFRNFNKAAENFYIAGTDRNMKYAVTQLENFYGVQLINVKGNKLEFTEFGEILGIECEKIYNLNLEINSILNRMNLKEVRFSTSIDFYKYYIKPVFDMFLKENTEAKVRLIKTNQFDAVQRLLNREIDFIVGSIPEEKNPDLVYLPIASAKIMIACSSENEEKFRDISSLLQLKDYRGATNDHTDPFYYNFKKNTDGQGVSLNIVYETSDFDSLIDAVRNKAVDYSLVGNYEMSADLYFKDISFLFNEVIICYIHRKNESLTAAIEKLIKISSKLKIKPKEL